MHAENLVVLLLADDLNEALFFANDARFARGAKGKLADFDIVTRIAGFRFTQTDRTNFRIAVRTIRNQPQINRSRILSGNVLDGDDAFLRGEVCEQRRRHHVTDCINAFLASLLMFVSFDESLFDFDLRSFQTKSFGVRHAADGDQKHLCLQLHLLAL